MSECNKNGATAIGLSILDPKMISLYMSFLCRSTYSFGIFKSFCPSSTLISEFSASQTYMVIITHEADLTSLAE